METPKPKAASDVAVNVVTRILVWLATTALCWIPLWLFLAARWIMSPEGFWQELVLGAIGIWVLGSVQFALAIVWLAITAVCLGVTAPKKKLKKKPVDGYIH